MSRILKCNWAEFICTNFHHNHRNTSVSWIKTIKNNQFPRDSSVFWCVACRASCQHFCILIPHSKLQFCSFFYDVPDGGRKIAMYEHKIYQTAREGLNWCRSLCNFDSIVRQMFNEGWWSSMSFQLQHSAHKIDEVCNSSWLWNFLQIRDLRNSEVTREVEIFSSSKNHNQKHVRRSWLRLRGDG